MTIKPCKSRLLVVAGQKYSFIPSHGSRNVLHTGNESHQCRQWIQFKFDFFLFVCIAKSIAILIPYLPRTRSAPWWVQQVFYPWNFVVQVGKVGLSVQTEVAGILNRVSNAILGKWRPIPSERSLIANITGYEVHEWKLIERQLIGPGNIVIVRGDFPCVFKVANDRITVQLISFSIFSVDFARRFTHKGLRLPVVIKLQRLRQIVFERIRAIPTPGLHHLRIDEQIGLHTEQFLRIVSNPARLIDSIHLRSNGELLQPEVKIEVRQPLHEFQLAQESNLPKWLEIFGGM